MSGYRPKLIEVALPLAAINAEAAREKSIRHGHPSTLHLWWARRPLAAARAVIWASLVDDPSGDESLTAAEQDAERARLFGILERLVRWENSNDPDVLAAARAEIDRCFPEGPPAVLDPFAGGGAIPLEAQRLGLTALAGDLNPVAVLINKAMIEIPPRFAGRPPVHPDIDTTLTTWDRAQGLAADVEAYGRQMRDEAERRIGHLYPDATGPGGEKLTPIAWIWARTVESPDPAWSGHVPLVASWVLANKPGKPKVWIEPIVDREAQTISYRVRESGEPTHERTVKGGHGRCVATGAAIPVDYIREQSRTDRLEHQMMAIVAEGERGRQYCEVRDLDVQMARIDVPEGAPTERLTLYPRSISIHIYGLDEWSKLFTARQLVALTTFSDLLSEVRERVLADAVACGFANGSVGAGSSSVGAEGIGGGPVGDHGWLSAEASGEIAPPASPPCSPPSASASWPLAADGAVEGGGPRLCDGGSGAEAYADAVVTYLAFAVDKCANLWSNLVTWMNDRGAFREVFARQAIPMAWDFAEANPFSGKGGSWDLCLAKVCKVVDQLPMVGESEVRQRDARARVREVVGAVLSTDPPYYDNVGYSYLSDFFFVWLRRNLSDIWPDECATLLTPKVDELIANRHRAGSKEQAEAHFESGMAEFMAEVVRCQAACVPATLYYAYKARETKDGEIRTTGWDTFLQAVLDAGLQVTATWPVRTESPGRILARGTNALASSIVLACRPRPVNAALATRGEFVAALRAELPAAVRVLQSDNISPVDMAQSTIGPGMKVFSRCARVVEADGSAMSVSSALGIINDVLGEILDGEEAELDAPTRFALTWFAQHGWDPASSGDADSLARAKNTSLAGIEEAGVGEARSGEFRLYERSELAEGWSPRDDPRLTVWEATQYLVIALERSQTEAAALLRQLGGYGDRARQLAYLLFTKASDNGWAAEAGVYNGLIAAWPSLRAAESDPEAPTLL